MAGPQEDLSFKYPEKEFLDLNQAVRLKEPKLPSDNALRREQIQMTPAPPPVVPTEPLTRSSAEHVQPISEHLPGQSSSQPIVIPQEGPPISPRDSQRVQDRINKLYGKMKSAEERAVEAESRLADILNKVETRLAGQNSQPFSPPSSFSPQPFEPAPTSFAQPPSVNDQPFITRQELANLLAQQTQFFVAHSEAREAQNVSRLEAERDFPDVYSSNELRDAVDQIFRSDPSLRSDPRGPYKAAAMVRGMTSGNAVAPSGLPPIARKEAIASLGPSVPEGQPQQADNKIARYNAALERARQTGRTEDAAYARLIQLGLA